jgi:hypothetical protein
MRKFPRILYFIPSTVPTLKEQAAALQLGPNCSFRNANLISVEGALEQCDGVAGCVPKRYAEAVDGYGKKLFPSAKEAIEIFQSELIEEINEANKTAKVDESKSKAGSGWKANA